MLFLIGAGLDQKDLSVKALETLRGVDEILIEDYTAPISQEYIDWISKETGRRVRMIGRTALEDSLKDTVAPAKTKDVAIIIPGDPLVATTHHILLDYAHAQRIPARVLHAPSIFSAAIGESGLDVYRFGPPTTITFWSEHYKPTSFIDVIAANLRNNLHTMLLFDIEPKTKRPMGLGAAIKLLVLAEEERHQNVINVNLPVVVMGNVGKEGQLAVYTTIQKANALAGDFEGKVITMIIPSNPNFAEQEGLSRFSR